MPSYMDTPRGRLTRVGGWELGQTLGRGAYAHVRLATHIVTGHQAACKILPALHGHPGIPVDWNATLDAIEAHKEMVLLKAFAGAKLAGVVRLEGVLEEGGWTYVFLTLYPHSLSSLAHPVPDVTIVPFFRKLLSAMHTLHMLDISHEDIKRSNVLLDIRGKDVHPILVDFGFSHFWPNNTRGVRSLGGTFDYSSPEKVADDRYDPRANDVWSLGVLLIKMLDIPHPYVDRNDPNETTKMAKRRIVDGDARWQWRDIDMVPGGRAELIMGMLERDPQKRMTIPQVLNHPYLDDPGIIPPATIPPMRLTSKVSRPVSQAVIQDLCFLAHIQGRFVLCETSKKVEQRLYGREPCWEQRWAVILAGWEQRAEIDWEDLPVIPERKSKSLPTRLRPIPSLRHIHLSPVHTPQDQPATEDSAMDVSTTAHQTPSKRATPDKEIVTPPPPATPIPTTKTKSRIKAMKGKNEAEAPTPTRTVLAVTRTVRAAVGGEVKKVMGPSAFGVRSKRPNTVFPNRAGQTKPDSSGSSTAVDSSVGVSGAKSAIPSRVPRPKKNSAAVTIQKKRLPPPVRLSPPEKKLQALALGPPDQAQPPRRSPRFV